MFCVKTKPTKLSQKMEIVLETDFPGESILSVLLE